MTWRVLRFIGLISLTVISFDVSQADTPYADPQSNIVITNTAQLGDLFLQGYSYPVGTWVWQPMMFEPVITVWANGLPGELAGLTNYAPTQLHGVPAWPLWITLYPLDGAAGEISVFKPWSDSELARIAVPQGFDSWPVYERVLRDTCVLGGINFTNWEALIEQGYNQFATPQVTMHAWLIDFANRDEYWNNYMAEQAEMAEAEEASMALSAASFTLQTMDEGDELNDLLLGTCGITNLTQPFFITSIQQQTNGMLITWQSCPVFRYVVLSTDELTTNTVWGEQAYVWGLADSTSWIDATTSNVDHRFYKVRRLLGSPIAAGGLHSLALRPDGTLWAWGYDDDGQLGDQTAGSSTAVDPTFPMARPFPVEVANPISCIGQTISNAVAVAGGGEDFTVVADADGRVWTWGTSIGEFDNAVFLLGDGGSRSSLLFQGIDLYVPSPISGVSNVVSVSVGYEHSLALRADGKVFAWGENGKGQLGIGSLSPDHTNSPVQSVVLTQIMAIAAGLSHSVALQQNGTVWTWGLGDAGQLGNGGTANLATATPLTTISNVIAIAAGYDHTITLTVEKKVWTWGGNLAGQLGRSGSNTVPEQVSGLSNVVAIAGGYQFSLAVTSNGQVYAWGDNSRGQLGTNTSGAAISTPHLVAGISNAVLVSAHAPSGQDGGLHSLAMTVKQGVNQYWAWGDNENGQVGSRTNLYQYAPVPVQFCTRCDRCVQLGTSGSFTAHCTGTLMLYFNDANFTDNGTNSYTVVVDGFGQTNVPGHAAAGSGAGVAIGTVTNGGVYAYSASGFCVRNDAGDKADPDGRDPSSNQVACTSINITNSVCPMLKCFSLVGKIQ